MTKTVNDVRARVVRQFGDESGAQVTDADIIRWINDAQVEICAKNEVLQARAYTNIGAGTDEYQLPADLLTVHSIYCQNQKLEYLSLIDFDNYIRVSDPDRLNNATSLVYTLWGETLRIYPIPQSAVTGGLVVYYIRKPAEVTLLTDLLDLPDQYFNRLVEYVLLQAYEMDEDWQAASQKGTSFESQLLAMKEQQNSRVRDTYPTITVLPEDM